YRRSLPPSEAGAAYDHLLRNRYRAVWDATIDGRLVRAGLRPASVREERLLDFRRAFPGLAERASQEFSRWFDAPRATHDQIVEFITAPTRSFERGSGVCPVCRLPVAEALVDAAQLSAAVRHVIESARPGWSPDEGICRQCADLYMAQHMPAIQC
ncbi:MAG: hypothetical protein HYX76_01540, partial [Acidobacteria bacterium]|nr:hypothetical protein [Acidobacteriota bacterium]